MNNLNIKAQSIITERRQLEIHAFNIGFCDKLMTILVADLLQGVFQIALDLDRIMSIAPGGLHIRKELRQSIYNAGRELDTEQVLTYEDVKTILSRYKDEIAAAAKENGILASTGDCRGACKYNTGDRSEYRNYGW